MARRLELSIDLSKVESVDALADAIRDVAAELGSRKEFPEDEARRIETPSGKEVGFWETVE